MGADLRQKIAHESMKVLVAEDNVVIQNLLRGLLTKWGYEVVLSKDGTEAWDRLQKEDGPRLAILDWVMPGMDGIEVCRRVRAQQGSSGYTYVILLSAKTDQEDIVAALEEGADDYVTKPFHADELRARIRSAMRVLQLETELERQAHYDSLTGLPNRTLLADRLQQGLHQAGRHSELLAFLYIDLDRFKVVNDSLGHAAGDELLQQVATRLKSCVRDCDTLARVGGDEFVLIASSLKSVEEASTIASRLLASLEPPFEIGTAQLKITASIGITIYPHDGEDPSSLQQNADAAMYDSKRRVRNGFQMFNKAIQHASRWQLEIEQKLARAIERNEFTLNYQPVYDLEDLQVREAEALIRWSRSSSDTITPATFIPVAEETGQILPIGAWVLAMACQQAQTWAVRGLRLPVSVNVSAQQFAQENFVASVQRALDESRLDPRLLKLEVTETVVMRDLSNLTGTLERLRELGVEIWIDDFGTGYSCFSYLHRLPVNTIKIAREFVADIGKHPRVLPLIRGIVTLAHNLGIRAVAEGVETAEQLTALRSSGCDAAQGFLLGKPQAAEGLEKILTAAGEARRVPSSLPNIVPAWLPV
jgi:diguanylate cyclase (GGDEF)-like protein